MRKLIVMSIAAVLALAGTSCTKKISQEVAATQQAINKLQYEQSRQAEELKKLQESQVDSIDGVAIKDIISGQQYQIEQINKQLTKTRKDLYQHLNEAGDLKGGNGANGGNFKLGSAVLSSEAKATLDKVAKDVKGDNNASVEIIGHTDNVGSDAINKTLSQKRAEAAKQYLVSKGVAASQISTKGVGASKPIVCNDDEASRAKNRRIEVIVKK
ncbi:MAG: OmpA family protein [Paludibacteraceae bacterium]|nr:OmpA family protein [Paludibacteraceae bacterium]